MMRSIPDWVLPFSAIAGPRLQLLEVGAVVPELDLHLEAGGIADPLDRRRDEDEADAFLQLGQLVGQLRVEAAQVLAAAALAPVLQDHVGGASVGERGVVVEHRDAADRDRVLDAGRAARDGRDPIHDPLGALERSALGQLDTGDDVALVLDRDEAGRQGRKPPDRERAKAQAERGGDQAVPDQARHEARVAALGGLVEAVEAAEEEIAALRRRAQPQGALRGLQGGGVDRADQRGRGHHQGELAVQLARDPRQEGGRQEHRPSGPG